MKRVFGIFSGLFECLPAAFAADLSIASPPPTMSVKAQSFDQRWELTFNDELRYYSFQSSQASPTLPLQFPKPPPGAASGSQIYSATGLQLDGKPSEDLQLQFLLRTGYISASQTIGTVTGSVSSLTDTTVGATATYNGWAGIQPFVSINVNLPTGTTNLSGNTTFARPDPDISALPTFGEGLNVGPTLGINVPITSALVASFSGGYTLRGAYNREAPILIGVPQGVNRLDPGDVLTANSTLGYRAGQVALQVSGTYSTETQTTIDGTPTYKTGDRYSVSGGGVYQWTASFSSQISASFTHWNNNKVVNINPPPPGLVLEAFNSNSDITQVNFVATYTQGPISIGPTAGYTYRNHNAYDPTSSAFLPAKTSWAVGGFIQGSVNQQIALSARVERRWTNEDNNPDKIFVPFGVPPPIPGTGNPAIISTGWMASIGGTIKF